MNDIEITLKLRSIYRELSEEHNFCCPCYLEIVISKRLRSSNGRIAWFTDRVTGELTSAKITMSNALLTEFGWDRFEKTFRHEIAHLANIILNGGSGHNHAFKRLCQKFGGTMNPTMAGWQYKSCADSGYVKTIDKWSYTCSCGYVRKMAKRMSWKKRLNRTHLCRKCRTNLSDWKEERIG